MRIDEIEDEIERLLGEPKRVELKTDRDIRFRTTYIEPYCCKCHSPMLPPHCGKTLLDNELEDGEPSAIAVMLLRNWNALRFLETHRCRVRIRIRG